MHYRRSEGVGVLVGALLLTGAVLGIGVWRFPEWLGIAPGSDRQIMVLLVIAAVTLVGLILLGGYHLLVNQLGHSVYGRFEPDDAPQPTQASVPEPQDDRVAQVQSYLHEQYGPLWRRKVRLLLVVGEPEQIDATAPGLAEQHWLEGQRTVLLWGGSVRAEREGGCLPSGTA